MVLDRIPQSLPVHFFGSRPQPPTSQYGLFTHKQTISTRNTSQSNIGKQIHTQKQNTHKIHQIHTKEEYTIEIIRSMIRQQIHTQKQNTHMQYIKCTNKRIVHT